jgi:hypothetical protein
MRLLCKPLHYLAGYFFNLRLKKKRIFKEEINFTFAKQTQRVLILNPKLKIINTIFETRIRTKRLELLRNHFHSCLRGDCLPNFNMFALLIFYSKTLNLKSKFNSSLYKILFLYIYLYFLFSQICHIIILFILHIYIKLIK